jgi:hypothetical protein
VLDIEATERLFLGSSWKTKDRCLSSKGAAGNNFHELLEEGLKSTSCSNAYISMDLDVLALPEISTGFSRGHIKLERLLEILDIIKSYKNIVAADILGYKIHHVPTQKFKPRLRLYYKPKPPKTRPYYNEVSYLTYLILACKILDKDCQDLIKFREKLVELNEKGENGVDFYKETENLRI